MNSTDYLFCWPPSVNTLYFQGKSHGQKFLSKKGKEYKKMLHHMYADDDIIKFTDPVSVKITLVPPDKRIRDIDNYNKAILDGLVDLGIIEDDSQIKHLDVQMLEPAIDYKKGCAIIQIMKHSKHIVSVDTVIKELIYNYKFELDDDIMNQFVK